MGNSATKRALTVLLLVLILVQMWGPVTPVKAADNVNPALTVSSPYGSEFYSEVQGYNLLTISGTVADSNDGDKTYIRYSVNGGTEQSLALNVKDGTDPSGDYLLTHTVSRAFAGTVDVTDWTEGVKTLRIWAVDDQGGVSAEKVVSVVVDKTAPTINPVKVERYATYINLETTATDANLATYPYRYIRRGSPDVIIGSSQSGQITDWGVTANQRYTYDVEVKDKGGHVTRTSVTTSTLALDPTLRLLDAGERDLKIKITHDVRNAVAPAVHLYVRESGQSTFGPIISSVSFVTAEEVTLTGLSPNHKYDVWAVSLNIDSASGSQRILLPSVWTNRPPTLVISPFASNRFSELSGRRTITLAGKAFDPDGNTLVVSANVNGVSKSMVIGQAPTSLPSADNWSLSWDVVDDGVSEGNHTISVTVDDQK